MPRLVDGEHAKPVQPAPPPPAEPSERVVPLSTQPGLTEIRPEQVETAAKLFEDSAEDVQDLIDDGRVKLQAQPMGNDDVSRHAALAFTKAGVEGATSHIAALEGFRDWLKGIAKGIRASAAQYEQGEQGNVARMRGVEHE